MGNAIKSVWNKYDSNNVLAFRKKIKEQAEKSFEKSSEQDLRTELKELQLTLRQTKDVKKKINDTIDAEIYELEAWERVLEERLNRMEKCHLNENEEDTQS